MFCPFRLLHEGFACRFLSRIFSVCLPFRSRFIATRLNTTIIITTKITISVVHNNAIINDIVTITVFSSCYLRTCRGTSKHSRALYVYALFGASSRFESPWMNAVHVRVTCLDSAVTNTFFRFFFISRLYLFSQISSNKTLWSDWLLPAAKRV